MRGEERWGDEDNEVGQSSRWAVGDPTRAWLGGAPAGVLPASGLAASEPALAVVGVLR